MKDKLKNMFTGKKRKENLVVLLVIVIIVVISINYRWRDVNISLDDNRGSDDVNKNGKIKESEKTKLKKYFSDTYKINESEIEIS